MAVENKPDILIRDFYPGDFDCGEPSFETVLNLSCERLWEKHVEYSIRRMREMDEELERIEKELEGLMDSAIPGSQNQRSQVPGPKVRGQSHAKIR